MGLAGVRPWSELSAPDQSWKRKAAQLLSCGLQTSAQAGTPHGAVWRIRAQCVGSQSDTMQISIGVD